MSHHRTKAHEIERRMVTPSGASDLIRILYIEDYVLDQELVRDALEHSPYHFDVHLATSFDEVTDRLAQATYDIILTDLNLGKFSGLDVIQHVQAAGVETPIIILTGTNSVANAAASLRLGAADFVIKDAGQLVRLPYVIRSVIERHDLETDRREKDRALRESEAKLRAMFNQSLDIILIIDVEDGTILNANRTLQRLLGYDPQMVIGQPYHILFPDETTTAPSDSQSDSQQFLDHVNTSDSVFVSQPFVRADGTVVPMDLTANMLMWGMQKAILMTLRDASERMQAESNRLRAETLREKLLQEKELRALRSRLVAMISHEFRTPLASIILSVDLLEMRAEAAGTGTEWEAGKLYEIRQQIHRMTSLVDDILFVDKMESGLLPFDPVPTEVVALIGAIVRDVKAGIGIDHDIVYKPLSAAMQASVDHKMMTQLLTNLLSNAIKYSQPGTRITVTLGLTDDAFHLAVADEGIGIPEKDQPKLFEMFHRATNTGTIRGTGVGLAIVKQAVDMHGGRVSFESKVGKGTVFLVDMPLEPAVPQDEEDTAR